MISKVYLNNSRLFFGLLGFSAVVTEVAVLIERNTFSAANFFSYFTIISNVLAALFLIVYSRNAKLKGSQQQRVELLRGAITLYMAMTGIIFSVLLANIENATLTAVPWDNIVLHYIMPIVLVVDWMFFPSKVSISFRQSIVWLSLPLAYIIYSLIRGHLVNWYPYPFLDPAEHGYGQVFITSIVMFVGTLSASWLLAKRTSN